MSKTQVEESPSNIERALAVGLEEAGELYQVCSAADARSDAAIRDFVAKCGIEVRKARVDDAAYEKLCRQRGVKLNATSRKRKEIGIIKAAAGKPDLNQPRWYDCAAYVALPCDGSPPPETVESAVKLIDSKGGLRDCADLYAVYRQGELEEADKRKPPPPTLAEECDALLTGIPHDATFLGESNGIEYPAPGYVLIVARIDRQDGHGRAWIYEEAEESNLKRLVHKIKRRSIAEDGPKIYIRRYAAALAEQAKSAKSAEQVKGVVAKVKAAAKAKREAAAPAAAKPELQQGECPECKAMFRLTDAGVLRSHKKWIGSPTNGMNKGCEGSRQPPVAGTVTPINEVAEAAE